MTFRAFRRIAGATAVASAALAIFLIWRGSQRPIFLNQSLATMAAAVVAAVVAITSVRVSLLGDSFESQFHQWNEHWRNLTPISAPIWLCFLSVVFALSLHSEIASRQRPVKGIDYVDDEADYLRVAKEIESLPGGVAGLLPALYRGEFAEDNRHPVYPALLAAGNQIHLGDRPLLMRPVDLSNAFGILVVLTTAVIGWKLFNPAVGAISSLLVSINGAMIQASSLIACETLLVLFTTLGWYWFAASLGTAVRGLGTTTFSSVVIAVLFALAYLTKASAAFPFFITVALVLFGGVDRDSKSRFLQAAVLLLVFTAVASPLLARNVVRYHNPLHSFNNRLLFAESYDDGVAEPDLGTRGNLQRYLGRHSVREVVVDRFLVGITWESFVLLRSLGPVGFDSGRAVFGSIVFASALLAFGTAAGGKLSPVFLLLWTAWFLLFFGWYQPIASGDRFLLPLVPPLSIAGSLGLACLANVVHSCYKNP